jgi:hypothetical protein
VIQLRAILADSLREALDRRALALLLALAGLVILVVASLDVESRDARTVLAEQARALHEFEHLRENHHSRRVSGVRVELLGGPRPVEGADEVPGGFEHGLVVELRVPTLDDARRLAAEWRDFRDDVQGRRRAARARPPDFEAFLAERFRELGYQVHVAQPRPREPRWLVAVRSGGRLDEMRGRNELTLFFGAVRIPLAGVSVAEVIVLIQLGLAGAFAGSVGMLVAVLVTAAFVPSMLQKGRLDLTLARPIGRGRLLLAKYLGGLWFVFLLAAVLVVGCWAALALRTGYGHPAFLLTIVTVLAQFAVLYSISVAVGVLTRSSGLAALATLGVWFVSGALAGVRRELGREFEAPHWFARALETLYTILPKTGDLDELNKVFLSQAHLSEDALRRATMLEPAPVDWAFSLGTTGAFTVAMLAIAVWVFGRRDW